MPTDVTSAHRVRDSKSASVEDCQASHSTFDADFFPDFNVDAGDAPELESARRFEFSPFDSHQSEDGPGGSDETRDDGELDLRIELGRTELSIEDALQLKQGAVVTLDKLAGDPVDILVNGRLIARGEVLLLDDRFSVRVVEILTGECEERRSLAGGDTDRTAVRLVRPPCGAGPRR